MRYRQYEDVGEILWMGNERQSKRKCLGASDAELGDK